MAKKKDEHSELGYLYENHGQGACVTAHFSRYKSGEQCSYRWQAAERACTEKSVNYLGADKDGRLSYYKTNKVLERFERYLASGAGRDVGRAGRKIEITIKPFSTGFYPWPNQAHHIIPRESLSIMVRDVGVKAGKDREGEMRLLVINGLLLEKYNLNDTLNMIILPEEDRDAKKMALPTHIGSHPTYTKKVDQMIKAKIVPKYSGLAGEVKAAKHLKDSKAPAVKSALESIEKQVYKVIIAKASAVTTVGNAAAKLDNLVGFM